jgi:hypothetical protein
VNDTIRRGHVSGSALRRSAYKVSRIRRKLHADIDKAGFNKLTDEQEGEAALRKLRRRA